jgi:hypothetical protein
LVVEMRVTAKHWSLSGSGQEEAGAKRRRGGKKKTLPWKGLRRRRREEKRSHAAGGHRSGDDREIPTALTGNSVERKVRMATGMV